MSGQAPGAVGAVLAPLLREISAKLDVLIAQTARTIDAPGPSAVEGVIVALDLSFAGRAFGAAEAIDRAVESDGRLLAALTKAGIDRNPRKLGILLAKIEGSEIAGLTARRIDEDRAGLIWILARV